MSRNELLKIAKQNNETIASMRMVALGSVRSHCRRVGYDLSTINGKEAWDILEDITSQYGIEQNRLFALFCRHCSDSQYRLFIANWSKKNTL